mgnify:CR=1 FL=1
MRFLTSYLSLKKDGVLLTGTDRMKKRPIKVLVDALNKIGATISYQGEEGYPPLNIKKKYLNSICEFACQIYRVTRGYQTVVNRLWWR